MKTTIIFSTEVFILRRQTLYVASYWTSSTGNSSKTGVFTFSVPMRELFGFMEDYRKIIIKVKHELIILLRAGSQDAVNHTLEITYVF